MPGVLSPKQQVTCCFGDKTLKANKAKIKIPELCDRCNPGNLCVLSDPHTKKPTLPPPPPSNTPSPHLSPTVHHVLRITEDRFVIASSSGPVSNPTRDRRNTDLHAGWHPGYRQSDDTG